MHGVLLAIAIAVGGILGDQPDPFALTAELGSSRFAQREAAESALTRMGRPALPALAKALASGDREVQTRAALILRRIEATLLVDPTTIQFDCDDVPIDEALAAINRQSGLRLTLAPALPALWANRRLTLHSAGPMPFWKAIDALCAAGQLHYVFGGQSDFELGDSTFLLYDGFAAHGGIFDDRGPFRVQLASLYYQSEVHLSADQPGSNQPIRGGLPATGLPAPQQSVSKQFFMQLLVGAEPRLAVAPDGPVRVIEAIDDQGRSLVNPIRSEVWQHESGYLGVNPSPLVHLRVDLAYPDPPAARLKRIKGTIPLVVSTRRPDPLEIPLAQAANKTFAHGRLAISVGEVRMGQAEQVTTIELTIKLGQPAVSGGSGAPGDGDESRSLASPQQLEVLDSAGRMIPWFPSSSFFNGDEARLTLTLLDRGAGPTQPTSIRYHEVIRDRTEIPFEFRNLPMP